MDRKTVLLDEAQLERQREYTRQLAALHQQRGKPVYALVDTFGCQQNVADSQHILGMLRDMGCQFTDDAAQADIVVLNTCAIRDHAEKRVYGNLGALTHTKKQNPEQVICLCGCMAQRPEVAEKVRQSYRHVDLVFGPQALWKFPELLYRVYTRRGRVFSVEDEHGTIAEGMPVVREGNVRAWVSIMYGCNNFCSYCIVPYVRGRERSREPQCIIDDVRQLAAEGYKEITLLGQNVNSYGKDVYKRQVMSRAQGINTDLSKVIGLSLSNGLVALSGALLCQYQGYADINMGRGAVVIGLAAVVIGEAVVKHISPNFAVRLTGVLVGAVIYYLVYQVIIFVGFDTDLLKMFSALVVAAFLGVPYVKKQLARKHHVKGGIRHA